MRLLALMLLLDVSALFPIIKCFSISAKSIRRNRQTSPMMGRFSLLLRNRNNMIDIVTEMDRLSPLNFNFDLYAAITLAGYAFEAYNYPKTGKVAHGTDGTAIIFTSTEYIRKVFEGVLLLHVLKCVLSKDVSEEEFMEKMLSGENPDPYAVINVSEVDHGTNKSQRVFDEMKTEVIKNTREPIWMARNMLYIQNKPERSSINIAVYDKDFLKSDDLIGTGAVSLSKLLHDSKLNSIPKVNIYSNVSVPIYKELPDVLNSFLWKKTVTRKHQIGTVLLNAEYVPFDLDDSGVEALKSDREEPDQRKATVDRMNRLPVGASPEVNWRDLLSNIMHRCSGKK